MIWNLNLKFLLHLSHNDIKGKSPHSLEYLTLYSVNLSDNHFKGSVPHFSLITRILSFKNNSFYGLFIYGISHINFNFIHVSFL